MFLIIFIIILPIGNFRYTFFHSSPKKISDLLEIYHFPDYYLLSKSLLADVFIRMEGLIYSFI